MLEKTKQTLPRQLRDSYPELPLDPDAFKPGHYKWPPHFTPLLLFVVFVGGCGGTFARYWASSHILDNAARWPTATFVINLLGAFLLGLLLEGLARRGPDQSIRRILRLAIGTGFLGAFTTFSAFAVDAVTLLQHDHVTLAIWYIGLSVILGLLSSAAGVWLAAMHYSRRSKRT